MQTTDRGIDGRRPFGKARPLVRTSDEGGATPTSGGGDAMSALACDRASSGGRALASGRAAVPAGRTARWARFDGVDAADLRRRRNRELVEALVDRASLLLPADRSLIEAVYADGRTVRELSVLIGEDARALRRRIRRLVARMTTPEFMIVAARRDRWPTQRRRVATLCTLHGLSLREAAEQLGLSLHAVRRHHAAVQTLVDHAFDEFDAVGRDGLSPARLRA